MVDALTGVRLLGGVVLLFANGFFVTTEFALTRVRQFDAAEFDAPGLRRAWEMTDRLEIFLSGCQVGITVSSVGLGVVAEPAVTAVIDAGLVAVGLTPAAGGHAAVSVLLALAVINLLHVVVGEQAPTYLGIERTKLVAKYGGPLLYWWTWVMWPVIKTADWVAKRLLGLFGVDITRSWTEEEAEGEADLPSSRGELRRRMGEELSNVGLSSERREEVLAALAIGNIPVEDVMVPADSVVALSTTESLEATLERVHEHPHARFPLVGDGLADYRGVVYTPALLRELDALERGDRTLESMAAPPMAVSAGTPVSEVIDQFQAENQELAVVLREGEVVGMVTATDCFEAITGELEDPLDPA
jgi:CBS domain containing-hemolysin-like protein